MTSKFKNGLILCTLLSFSLTAIASDLKKDIASVYEDVRSNRQQIREAEHKAMIAELQARAKKASDSTNPSSASPNFEQPMMSQDYYQSMPINVTGDNARSSADSSKPTLLEIKGNSAHIVFDGELREVSKGNAFGGYIVEDVRSDSVVLSFDGNKTILKIRW